MIKDFTLNETNVIMNFSVKFCTTEADMLQSASFAKVISKYVKKLKASGDLLYNYLYQVTNKNIEEVVLDMFKLLIILNADEVKRINPIYENLLNEQVHFVDFVEGLYDFWRAFERYAVIQQKVKSEGIQNVSFIEGTNAFNNLILKTYRTIIETVNGKGQNIYRQLSAGVNCGIELSDIYWELPSGYECLKNVPFINSIVLRPPFIVYSKKNKRTGTYKEIYTNPLEDVQLRPNHWFCYPAMVGESLAYVYFHRDYMSHGISLCNLFQLAKPEDYEGKKPNLVYVFGARKEDYEESSYFYHDKENDIYVGIAYHTDDIDYFGYMKKMMLTLHNTRMIDNGCLPIHGAMVSATFKDGRKYNLAFMGDSGAGKSETLEAFKTVSGEYLKEITTIFDDMGSFKLEGDDVVAYGTEIGAFVRLDDLDPSYAYTEMDRAVFMNPNKTNARVIIPAATYEEIMKGYKVDLFLYANNYEDSDEILLFDTPKAAIDEFKKGARMAKGTTGEIGLVESFFANPFGPVQRQEQTNVLLDKYFTALYNKNIPVGQMYTRLGIPGKEKSGPQIAATNILNWVKNKK